MELACGIDWRRNSGIALAFHGVKDLDIPLGEVLEMAQIKAFDKTPG
jgi:hypothetical protein